MYPSSDLTGQDGGEMVVEGDESGEVLGFSEEEGLFLFGMVVFKRTRLKVNI